jgi:D-alanyl-D-alanine carboxypeptidase/D-alanyl-D-alanine-endopeptidase (penicillin-binding protein 4)
MPASTIKIFTAALALRALGPDTRLPTRVTLLGRDENDPTRATISLVAGGDPLLSSANLRELAKKTHAALAPQGITSLDVAFDDSLFPPPTPAPGWRGSYSLSTVAPVRALVRDRRNFSDTSKDTATFFNKRLKAEGFQTRLIGRQSGTSSSPEVDSYRGHTVSHAVRLMSVLSDNDIAENLFRHTAIARGFPPTWAGASAAMTAESRQLGILTEGLNFVDGSGLSRSNRLTSDSLVALLQKAGSGADSSLAGLADSTYLATAGRSGTLSGRFRNEKTSCSRGAIDAKTGSLRDVVALAGLATGVDGHRRAFAVLVNGQTVQSGPRRISNAIDSLTTTLVGCR